MSMKSPDPFSRESVWQALKDLHNLHELENHPLTALGIVERRCQSIGRIYKSTQRGLWLRSVLEDAIEELRINSAEPNASDKRWRPYIILKKEFVEEVAFDYLAEEELYVSIRTYQYARGEALDRLASILRQWEDESGLDPTTASWSRLVDLGRRQLTRSLESFQEQGSGKYISSLYCSRETIEDEIAFFLESDKTGLVIIGEAGCGKTNLICRMAERLSEQGHLVLLYNCASLSSLEVNQEIAQDLLLSGATSFVEHIEHISQEAINADRYCIVFLDAINEFQFEDSCRTGDLLHNTNSLVSRCSFPRIKLVLTCRTPTWERLDIIGYTDLDWGCYYSQDDEKVLVLGGFTELEFERTYPIYRQYFELRSDCASLSPVVARRCHDPLMLRLTASAYSGREMPFFSPSLTIFNEYYDRIARRVDQRFLELLAAEMWAEKTPALSYDHVCEHEKLGQEVVEGQDCAYERLRDLGFLMEVERGLDIFVQFTYERVFEYALSRYILKSREVLDASTITQFLGDVSTFPSMWGAIQFTLLASDKKGELLVQLAGSTDYLLRQLVLETLLLEYQDAPEEVTGWLLGMVNARSELVRRLALNTAYHIGEDARPVFLAAVSSREADARLSVAEYTLLLWRRDPDAGVRASRAFVDLVGSCALSELPHILDTLFRTGYLICSNIRDKRLIWQTIQLEQRAYRELGITSTEFFNTPIGKIVERIVLSILQKVITRALRTVTGGTGGTSPLLSLESAFDISQENRERLERLAPFFDPSQEGFQELKDDLYQLYEAQRGIPITMTSGIVSIQLASNFPHTSELLRELFDRLGNRGKVSIFLPFINLHFPTSLEYYELVWGLAKKLLNEKPEIFLSDPWGTGDYLDVSVMAGIVSCLQTGRLETHSWLIRRALETSDQRLLKKSVSNLATLGFFFPQQALDVIFESEFDLTAQPVVDELVQSLAAIRTQHTEAVDRALVRYGIPSEIVHRVCAIASLDLIQICIDGISLWNTAVFYAMNSPSVLEFWQFGALQIARAKTIEDVARPITREIWKKFKDSDLSLAKAILGNEYFAEFEQ